jgi:hypothetical protein
MAYDFLSCPAGTIARICQNPDAACFIPAAGDLFICQNRE